MKLTRVDSSLIAPLLGLLGFACGSADGAASQTDLDVGTAAQALPAERPNGEAEIWSRRLGIDPRRDRALWATGKILVTRPTNIEYCSATMIGPHIAMTAGHCGPGSNATMEFFIYDNPGDPTAVRTEKFNCRIFLNTFPETDLMLMYCDSNFFLEAPGDKYGYLDFDLWHMPDQPVDYYSTRDMNLAVDQKRYSGWANDVVTLGTADHLIYSEGALKSSDRGTMWFSPSPINTQRTDMGQCSTTDDLPLSATWNMWSDAGCSGSAIISNKSHRLSSGPISTAAQPGFGRNSLPIADYLSRAVVQTPNSPPCGLGGDGWPKMVDGAFLQQRFGITSTPAGYLDTDHDGVFDIQEKIERAQGEHIQRAHFMNFDSERQNELWTLSGATIQPFNIGSSGRMIMRAGGSGWVKQASHSRLGLENNVAYHVDLRVLTNRPYRVCVSGRCMERPSTNSAWQRQGNMIVGGTGTTLEIWTQGTGETQIDEIAVVQDAFHDMQSAQQRAVWRDISSTHAPAEDVPIFMPYGPVPFGDADFTALVRGSLSTTAPRYALESTSMPFRVGNNRVCIDAKRRLSGQFDSNPLFVRVEPKGAAAREFSFVVSANWTEFCTPDFNLTTADVTLKFGAIADHFVDNVVVFH